MLFLWRQIRLTIIETNSMPGIKHLIPEANKQFIPFNVRVKLLACTCYFRFRINGTPVEVIPRRLGYLRIGSTGTRMMIFVSTS